MRRKSPEIGAQREVAGQRGGAGWARTGDRRIIPLDGLLIAQSCLVGVQAGGSPSASLKQQIAALVKSDPELLQPLAIRAGCTPLRGEARREVTDRDSHRANR